MNRATEQEKNISRQRLMQIFSRRKPEQEASPVEGSDAPLYDWTCPHHFEPVEWLMMKNLGKKIATYIEKSLSLVCLDEPKVSFKSVVQEFASVLADKALRQEKPQYFMPLQVSAKDSDGYVNFQFEAATVLIAQMLRDTESAVGPNGQLSTLEESILQDGAMVISDAIILALEEHGEIKVKHADRLVKGDWPLAARQLQDLCGFCFTLAYPKQAVDITVLFVAEAIDPAVGIRRTQRTLNSTELSRMIVRQLYDVPVDVTARLCVSSIRMEDLMRLENGDVLVLDKKINEPVEVLFNRRVCFQAWPVACEGKQAMLMIQTKK
jgi:flagellar motor switch/type III secretory pathway protein FliN